MSRIAKERTPASHLALRVGKESAAGKALPFELLDSPGIIPAKQLNQRAAARLAICGDIGDASYDTRLVAEALVEELTLRSDPRYTKDARANLKSKYGVDPDEFAPDLYVDELAEVRYEGDSVTAAMAILTDFRAGRLGKLALEGPNWKPKRSAPAEPEPVAPAAPLRPLTPEEADFERRLADGDFSGW